MDDEIDLAIQSLQPLFLKGTQNILLLISATYRELHFPDCDLYDLFYFSCLFLSILVKRFPKEERLRYTQNIPELLSDPAKDGFKFCEEIMNAKLTTTEDRETAAQLLMSKLGGNQSANGESILIALSKDLEKMAMQESGIWKQKENYHPNPKITKHIEDVLIMKFDQLINHVLEDAAHQSKTDINPVLFFLVVAVVHIGLIAGYGAKLFRQSLDDFMKPGIEKFMQSIYSDRMMKECLH